MKKFTPANAAEPEQGSSAHSLNGDGVAASSRSTASSAATALEALPDAFGASRFDDLLQGQSEALELIASGASLDLVLRHIALLVERIAQPALCSIHLLDPEAKVLRHGAAPSLPADYARIIDGSEIGPDGSPFHAAAFSRIRIDVANLEADDRWPEFRGLALASNLRATCAQPILDRADQVLGVLALHYRQSHQLVVGDYRLMDAMASFTAFGIESVGRERALESANKSF
ncbi:MAG: GAF domain-containing protein, partial [Rhodospirillales bacterium]|nr:GAF domain-containing protein [Rhodospirillales bacterium]